MQWNKTIPQDRIHGIFRGFKLTWKSVTSEITHQGFTELGPETDEYNVTELLQCTNYWIGVSGRTTMGAGIESSELVYTDHGGTYT